jgi:hypothetical protein
LERENAAASAQPLPWSQSFQRTSPELSALLGRLLSQPLQAPGSPPHTARKPSAPAQETRKEEGGVSTDKSCMLRTVCLQTFKTRGLKSKGTSLHCKESMTRPSPQRAAAERCGGQGNSAATGSCRFSSWKSPRQARYRDIISGKAESNSPAAHSQNVQDSSWALSTRFDELANLTTGMTRDSSQAAQLQANCTRSQGPEKAASDAELHAEHMGHPPSTRHGLSADISNTLSRGASAPANRACMRAHVRLAQTALAWQAMPSESSRRTGSSFGGGDIVAPRVKEGWEGRPGNAGFFGGCEAQAQECPGYRALPEGRFEVVWRGATSVVPEQSGAGLLVRLPSGVQVVRAAGAKNAAVAKKQEAQMLRQLGAERCTQNKAGHVWGGLQGLHSRPGRRANLEE